MIKTGTIFMVYFTIYVITFFETVLEYSSIDHYSRLLALENSNLSYKMILKSIDRLFVYSQENCTFLYKAGLHAIAPMKSPMDYSSYSYGCPP